MPKYLLLLRDDPSKFASLSPEEMQRVIQKYSTWSAGLAKAGQIVSGDKLTDTTETARVMRRNGAAIRTFDGPFAETKEVVGGFFMINAATIEEATKIAEGCPQLDYGSVEVRQVEEMR